MRTLLGLLTPIIMGILGREQRASGLDTNGPARMLTGQKEEIPGAMPAGLRHFWSRVACTKTSALHGGSELRRLAL